MTTASFTHSASWTAITFTPQSLASDTNLLAGAESDVLDIDALNAVDVIFAGKIRTGTSPTASRAIEVYVYVQTVSGYTGGCTGADGDRTITAEQKAQLRFVVSVPTNATSDTDYSFEFSVLDALKYLPAKAGVWIAHNTAVALNATGSNHELSYKVIKADSA